mmetsp:Transcript_7731/g.19585  ORF Transcript_7731/g.19585 Transcript_7731/m.19585 type:complete len:139 (+) Transcript_7731:3252-3668(+)
MVPNDPSGDLSRPNQLRFVYNGEKCPPLDAVGAGIISCIDAAGAPSTLPNHVTVEAGLVFVNFFDGLVFKGSDFVLESDGGNNIFDVVDFVIRDSNNHEVYQTFRLQNGCSSDTIQGIVLGQSYASVTFSGFRCQHDI